MKMNRISTTVLLLACLLLGVSAGYGLPAKTLFEQGMEAFKSKNFGSAELLFNKIIDADDSDYKDRAMFYHALAIYHQKKYKSAIYEFNNFINNSHDATLSSESRFWIGQCYFRQQEYLKAIEEFKRYISINKDGALVSASYEMIGRIYYRMNRYDEAILEWETALTKGTDRVKNARIIVRIAQALFNSQKYDEAIERLNPVLTSSLDNAVIARSRILMGRICQIKGDHKKALQYLNSIPYQLLKEKNFASAQYYKAKSYIELNSLTNAKVYLDMYLLMGKDMKFYLDAAYELGNILAEGNDATKAIALLEEVVKNSKNAELRIKAARRLGEIYIEKDPGKAIPYLEEALSADSQDSSKDTLLFIARTYLKAKRYREAARPLDQFIKKYPHDSRIGEAYFLRAKIYLETDETDRAMKTFEKIEKLDPFSPYLNESHYFLAVAYMKKGNTKRASLLLEKYLTFNKIENRYQAQVLLLDICLTENNTAKATPLINGIIKNSLKEKGVEDVLLKYGRSVQRRGQNPDYYFGLITSRFPDSEATRSVYHAYAQDHYKNKNYRKAEEYYARYLASNPKEGVDDAYYSRLVCLYRMEKYIELLSVIQKNKLLLTDEKILKEIFLLTVRSHFKLGHKQEVYRLMITEKLKGFSPEDVMMFAECAVSVNDIKSAKDSARYLGTRNDMRSRLFYLIGNYYYRSKKYGEAIDIYTSTIEDYSSNIYTEKARLDLARIYYKKKKYKEAKALLAGITAKELAVDKTAVLVNCLFRTGKEEEAAETTLQHLDSLRKIEAGRSVFQKNLKYYSDHKNAREFNRFLQILLSYKKISPQTDYLAGRMSYQSGNWTRAQYHFSRVVSSENKYRAGAYYHLFMISLMVSRNFNQAQIYYSNLEKTAPENDPYIMKAKFNLAIFKNETNSKEESKKLLQAIIKCEDKGFLPIQAQNLMEAYGFQK